MMIQKNKLTLNEEKNLVESAKTDKDSFSKIYEIYFNQIYYYIFHRVSDRDLTEDLTSQVFMKVLENIQKFQWRGAPFVAWVYRIASNVIANHYRTNKHLSKVDLDDVSFLVIDEELSALDSLKEKEEEKENVLEYEKIKYALSKLKPKYADILSLKFFEEKSNSEISEILDIKEGNIRIRLFRALKQLKKILDK
jgi:RNA polymerase sigma-70 factor, ECF subfamily